MTDDTYVPLPPQVIEALPNGQAVKRQLLNAMDEQYSLLTKARGDVVTREDTWPVVRTVTSWAEQAKDLKAAFEAGRKRAHELLEDELATAVGEQDGIPNEAMTVPDLGGDIRLKVNTSNVHHIDVDSLISAAVAVHLGGGQVEAVHDVVNGDHVDIKPDQLADYLAELASDVVRSVLACGKFEPQITKVTAYADEIARGGEDHLSGFVRGAIKTTVKSDGVTMTRKAQR